MNNYNKRNTLTNFQNEPEPISMIKNPQTPEQVFDGSIQGVLYRSTGDYASVEFLVGTNRLVTKVGYIYNVGINFLTLYDDVADNFIVCDLYSIKFITIDPVKSVLTAFDIPFSQATIRLLEKNDITRESNRTIRSRSN